MVSPEDISILKFRAFTAKVTKHGVYAFYTENGKKKRIGRYLSRLILKVKKLKVDHWSADTLDNRRPNLRRATTGQNNCNRKKRNDATTSRFKGVSRHRDKWQAQVQFKGFSRYGIFDTETEAMEAREKWSKELHGRFASSRS